MPQYSSLTRSVSLSLLVILSFIVCQVNDTGMIGGGDHMLEDMKWIAQLVVKRMEKIYHPHLERDIKTAKSAALAGGWRSKRQILTAQETVGSLVC